MAEEQLQIKIQAQVDQALKSLRDINKLLKDTESAGAGVGGKAMPKLEQGVTGANTALVNFGHVVQDAPFGLIGIANNIDPLISSFQSLRAQTGSAGAAFRALGGALLGPAGIAIGVSAVTSALIAFGPQIKNFISGTKEANKAQQEAAQAISGSYTEVLLLVEAYKREGTSLKERKDILSQLNTVSDKYFGGLSAEKTTIEQLDAAYKGYIDNLLRSFAVKQLEQELDPFIKKLATAQLTIKQFTQANEGLDVSGVAESTREIIRLRGAAAANIVPADVLNYVAALEQEQKARDEINQRIQNAVILTEGLTKNQKTQNETFKKLADDNPLVDFWDDVDIAATRSQISSARAFRVVRENAELIRQQKPLLDQLDAIRNNPATPRAGGPNVRLNPELAAQLQQAKDELKAGQDALVQIAQLYEITLTDAFSNLFSTIGQDGPDAFKKLGQSIIETTKRLLIQLAVQKALVAILNGISPGAGTAFEQQSRSGSLFSDLRFLQFGLNRGTR